MKKILFIPLLLFAFTSLNAQFKYKIQYDYNVLANSAAVDPGASVEVYVSARSGNNTVDSNFLTAVFSAPGPVRRIRDEVVEYTREIDNFNVFHFASSGGASCPNNGTTQNFTFSGSECTFLPFAISGSNNCAFLFQNGLQKLFQIEDFASLNPGPGEIKECDGANIRVSSLCDFSYSVEATILSTGQKITVLPYENHGSSFNLRPSDIPGISTGETFALQVFYVENPSMAANSNDISNTVTYRFTACAPDLDTNVDPNPQGIEPLCNGEDDGSVVITFEDDLATDKKMVINLFREGSPGVFDVFARTSGDLLTADFVNRSYTFTRGSGIPAGNYIARWQIGPISGGLDDGKESSPFNIDEPAPVSFTFSKTDVSCEGDTNGAINVTPTGGTGSYTYAWTGPNGYTNTVDEDITALEAGDYTLIVTDTNGCPSASQTITITANSTKPDLDSFLIFQPGDPPTFSPTGTITITNVIGGDGNYAYSWTKDGASFTPADPTNLTGLDPGEYKLLITDDNGAGCVSDEYTFTINALPALTISFTETQGITCDGDTGRITAQGIGGTGGYTYLWSTGATTPFIDVGQGTYSVTVTDSGGGSVTDSYTFNYQNPLLTVMENSTNILCRGDNTGSIDLTITGGNGGPYTVSWLDDPTNDEDRTNLTAGTYVYFVTDGDCTVTNDGIGIEITEPVLGLTVSQTSKTDVTINGGNDGALTVQVENGTAPYTSYDWTRDIGLGPIAFTPPAGSTDTNLVSLEAGEYQVVVTDTNGCTASLAVPITINEPGPLGITSLNPTAVNCKGEATGAINAIVTGTAPFNFVWERQGDPGFTAPNQANISNLPEGTYLLRLTDATASPEVTDTIVITEPTDALDATLTPLPASCFGGNDGSIRVNAIGGTPPYQYSRDDGFNFQTGDTFNGLLPNTYEILVLDDNNCEFKISTTVGQPDQIDIVIDQQNNVTTSGGNDGSINITVTNGTPPYSYAWTGPNGYTNTVDEDINSLQAGDYELTVTDSNGCTFSLPQPVMITEPGPLTILDLDGTDVACKNDATGSITATITGTAPFNFVWERQGDAGFTAPNQPTINNLIAGTYILRLTDASTNPEVTDTVTILEPLDALGANAVPTDVSCFGGNDGNVQINASGGTPPYRYSLNGGAFQTNNIFPDLIANMYAVTVLDGNDCAFIIPGAITVDEPQEMGLIIDVQTSLSAAGASDGAISITAFGGTAPYTYEWFADNGFTSTDEDISNLEGGNYTLIIRDSNQQNDTDGCTYIQDFLIAEPGVLQATLTETVSLECNGDDFGEITATVQGGVTPYTYQWFRRVGANDTELTEDTGILANLIAGEYFLRITDANNIVVESAVLNLMEPSLLEILLDNTTDVLCNGESTGAIDITVTGGTPPYTYIWDNGDTTEDVSNLTAGDYLLEVVDDNGCLADLNIVINNVHDVLEITSANITNGSGYQTNDGRISIVIDGGLPPYNIVWTRVSDNQNLGNTLDISNLLAGEYQVDVTDANGCPLTEIFTVTEPDIVEETITSPSCTGDSNGSIEVIVNQGNGSFTYSWNTGATTNFIDGLGAGSYTVTITGFGDGPLVRTYVIEDPLPLEVDLGEDRVLCLDQELVLDATVEDTTAIYEWTSDNGFSSSEPSINIAQTGNYTVTVSTESGCTAMGSIFVAVSTDEINAEFAVSSQVFVGEALIAVDISFPLPDTLEWIIPDEATVLNQDSDELELVFPEPGEYEVGIRTTKGDCIAMQQKKVLVLAEDGTVADGNTENGSKLIEEFIVYPNPTTGRFTADVNLTERGNISIKVFNLTSNALRASEKARGETTYSIPFDLSGLPSGVYAVLLETPYGDTVRKIIIQ